MAQQNIDFGTFPNDPTADAIREAFRKTQENFTELYREQTTSGVTSLTAGNGTSVVDSAGQPRSAGALTVNANIAFLNLVSPRRSINFGGASNALSISQSAVINYDVNTSLRLTSLVLTDTGNTGPTSTANNLTIDSGGNITTNGSLNIPTIRLFTSNGSANAAKQNAVLFANATNAIDGSPNFTWDNANSNLSIIGRVTITGNTTVGSNLRINGGILYTDLPSIDVFSTSTTTANANLFSYLSNISIASQSDANIIIGNSGNQGFVQIRSTNSAQNYSNGALRVIGGISTQGNIYAVGDIQTTYSANISAYGSNNEIQFNSGGNFASGTSGNLRSSGNLTFNPLSSTLTLQGSYTVSNGTVTYTNTAFTTDGVITATNAVSITGNLSVSDGVITLANAPLSTNSSVTINGNLTQNGNVNISNGNITLANAPLTTNSSVTINGNLTQNGNVAISNGNITLANAPLTTNSSVTINNTLTQNGTATFSNGNVTYSNAPLTLLDANSTLVVNSNATFAGNRFTVSSNTPATFANTVSVNGTLTANSNVAIGGNISVTGNYTSTSGSVRLTNGNLTTTNGNLNVGTGSNITTIGNGVLQVGTNGATINSSGDIQTDGKISAYSGTTGNTQVQFNDGGNLAGDNNFLWDRSTSVLTVDGTANLTTINTTTLVAANATLGNLTAVNFVGNGAALSNINAAAITSGTLDSNRLPTTGVIAATYGNSIAVSQITVDRWGRITSAQSTNIANVTITTDNSSFSFIPGSSINILGFANRTSVTSTGSSITISTPQDIATTSSPRFAALTVTGTANLGGLSGGGSVSGTWTLGTGATWQATYADLAEHYSADADYLPGTILEIGGNKEVTLSTTVDSTKIAGVVTTEPAYVLNAVNTYAHRAIIALAGRTPVRVTGPVSKGDILTSAGNGTAHVNNTPPCGAIIGRALEDHIPDNDGSEGLITVMIGK